MKKLFAEIPGEKNVFPSQLNKKVDNILISLKALWMEL